MHINTKIMRKFDNQVSLPFVCMQSNCELGWYFFPKRENSEYNMFEYQLFVKKNQKI